MWIQKFNQKTANGENIWKQLQRRKPDAIFNLITYNWEFEAIWG